MCLIAISAPVLFILPDSQHCHTPHLTMGWPKVSDEQKKEACQEASWTYRIWQKEQAAAAKTDLCASGPVSASTRDPMEPLSPCSSQAPPAGKWLLSNSVTHMAPADCLCRTILAPPMIQAFCDIPSVLLLLDKPPHSVLTASNPSEILCTLALLTLSA